jgi:TfdA family taurine catabolism dioxygenase TauD
VLDQFHHPEYTDILVLSNVRKNGEPKGLADGGTYWHSDYSYLQIPACATLLYSIQVPKVGGDTLFADQEQAYEDPPAAMKERIDGMMTLNVYGNRDDLDLSSRTSAFAPTEEQMEKRGATLVRHPPARRHPYTGRKALYAVSGTSFAIEGMPRRRGPLPAGRAGRAFDPAEVPVPDEVRCGRRGGVGQRIGAALCDPHRSGRCAYTVPHHSKGSATTCCLINP